MNISFIQPTRNNLKYLEWSYNSIRKNQGNHNVEICVADDASTDGTWEWCQKTMQIDNNFKAIQNKGPERLGHTVLYDRLINEVASNDICIIYHADMYLCPDALDAIKKHIKPKTIVSLTRIEPPLHPDGPEKLLVDFGVEPEYFNEDKFLKWFGNTPKQKHNQETTTGIFAPWAFYKEDFQEIGGHDELYKPQSKEDSDLFNRFQLNKMYFIQTWEGFVYHMTCRGSRFNPTLTTPGINSKEWEQQNIRSARNFIRKWGSYVKHDLFMNPIIIPKYDIGYKIKNCQLQHLFAFEPWCTTLISDCKDIKTYIQNEQNNTKFNLNKKLHSYNFELNNDICIEFDASKLTQNSINILQQLPEIITESGEVGNFELDIFKINIKLLKSYENELIHINSEYYQSKLKF